MNEEAKKPEDNTRFGWWTDFKSQFWHTAKILNSIFFHGGLFVIWFGLDTFFEWAASLVETHGIHGWIIYAFRWIASLAILSVASLDAMSDIARFIGAVKKAFHDAWVGK